MRFILHPETLNKVYPAAVTPNLGVRVLVCLVLTSSAFFCATTVTNAQNVIEDNGNWSDQDIWEDGDIANNVNENVVLDDDDMGTIRVDGNFTCGNLDLDEENELRINSNRTLNVGSNGAPRSVDGGDDSEITIDANGNLIVWGNFRVRNDFAMNITGTLTIKGNLTLDGGASLTINGSGSVVVEGDLIAGENVDLIVPGNLEVQDDIRADTRFDMNVSGSLSVADDFEVDGGGDNGEGADISVSGDFQVGNDFLANGDYHDITVTETGNMSVGDDFQTDDDLDLVVDGALAVGDNFTGDSNTDMNVDGSFDVGHDVTLGDEADLVLDGTMTVGDDIQAADDFDVVVENDGDLTVTDDFIVDDEMDLTVDNGGEVSIGDDFVSDDDADLNVDGSVDIGGDITTDENTGSSIDGTGTVGIGGTCTGDADVFCGSSILPITLLYFNGEVAGESVSLTWATSMEEHFDRFVVERSSDGITFTTIGEIPGEGRNIANVVNEYSFEDVFPLQGRNYYRLKNVDIDLKYAYSGIVVVTIEAAKTLAVHPNPAHAFIHFRINFQPEEGDYVVLINSLGRPVFQRAVTAIEQGEIVLAPEITPGIYVLKYISSKGELFSRVVIR